MEKGKGSTAGDHCVVLNLWEICLRVEKNGQGEEAVLYGEESRE